MFLQNKLDRLYKVLHESTYSTLSATYSVLAACLTFLSLDPPLQPPLHNNTTTAPSPLPCFPIESHIRINTQYTLLILLHLPLHLLLPETILTPHSRSLTQCSIPELLRLIAISGIDSLLSALLEVFERAPGRLSRAGLGVTGRFGDTEGRW